MIVDDDVSYLELASTFLMAEGHEVISAEDGKEALNNLDQNPDLILLDVLMPGMSGIEVLDQVKKMDPDVKVALLTQVDREDVPEDVKPTDFIEKERVSSKDRFLERVEKNL